jgi:hypothetical protein
MNHSTNGRVRDYLFGLGRSKTARIFTLAIGSNNMAGTTVSAINSKLKIKATETPFFVELNN